jgi:membrane-associated phospholipid phosphatase
LDTHVLMFIADFGDVAVIGPAFAAALMVLLAARRRREAAAWGCAVLGCAAVTLLLKASLGRFVVTVFGHPIHARSFPSGHAALSFVFYIGLAGLLWRGSGSVLFRSLAVLLVALQIAVTLSVFLLFWHPLTDMVAGLCLGALCLALAHRALTAEPPAGRRALTGVVLAVAVLVTALHGERFDDRKLNGQLFRSLAAEWSL